MNKEIELFVKLKYQIVTSDINTWNLSETYPDEVKKKWAWRCATDVEHLADNDPKSKHFIEIAKKYRDGLATIDELDDAWMSVINNKNYNICASIYNALQINQSHTRHAATAACFAAGAKYHYYTEICKKKWNEYIEWLIEELYNFECNRA